MKRGWREAGGGITQDFAVLDAEGFDPALLAEGERDEKPQLNQLGNGKVLVELLPKGIIGNL